MKLTSCPCLRRTLERMREPSAKIVLFRLTKKIFRRRTWVDEPEGRRESEGPNPIAWGGGSAASGAPRPGRGLCVERVGHGHAREDLRLAACLPEEEFFPLGHLSSRCGRGR